MPDKILVVDDEVEIADLIEVYLNNENYSVFKFYSAKEALECINTTNLDLAILDVMLPDIDGYGGTIHASSENDTVTFTVQLPAADSENIYPSSSFSQETNN